MVVGVTVRDFLPLLLSAGGAAFITAIFLGIKSLREGRAASEESVVKRLNEDAKQAHADADSQRERAIRAENEREDMRMQRDRANEEVARLRRIMIRSGFDPDPDGKR